MRITSILPPPAAKGLRLIEFTIAFPKDLKTADFQEEKLFSPESSLTEIFNLLI